jgi:hypothetical protein
VKAVNVSPARAWTTAFFGPLASYPTWFVKIFAFRLLTLTAAGLQAAATTRQIERHRLKVTAVFLDMGLSSSRGCVTARPF